MYLLTVIPPLKLPHNPPHPRVSPLASGYGPPAHFTRGTLVPLCPDLHSQTALISREYGLPSSAGIVLYLVDDASHGPRISDSAWALLWAPYFDNDDDDQLDSDYDLFSPNTDNDHEPPLPSSSSSSNANLTSNNHNHPKNSHLHSRYNIALSSSKAHRFSARSSPSPNVSYSRTSIRDDASVRRPHSLGTSSSSYRLRASASSAVTTAVQNRKGLFGHPSIVGTIEFDIDTRRSGARWFDAWIRSASEATPQPPLPHSQSLSLALSHPQESNSTKDFRELRENKERYARSNADSLPYVSSAQFTPYRRPHRPLKSSSSHKSFSPSPSLDRAHILPRSSSHHSNLASSSSPPPSGYAPLPDQDHDQDQDATTNDDADADDHANDADEDYSQDSNTKRFPSFFASSEENSVYTDDPLGDVFPPDSKTWANFSNDTHLIDLQSDQQSNNDNSDVHDNGVDENERTPVGLGIPDFNRFALSVNDHSTSLDDSLDNVNQDPTKEADLQVDEVVQIANDQGAQRPVLSFPNEKRELTPKSKEINLDKELPALSNSSKESLNLIDLEKSSGSASSPRSTSTPQPPHTPQANDLKLETDYQDVTPQPSPSQSKQAAPLPSPPKALTPSTPNTADNLKPPPSPSSFSPATPTKKSGFTSSNPSSPSSWSNSISNFAAAVGNVVSRHRNAPSSSSTSPVSPAMPITSSEQQQSETIVTNEETSTIAKNIMSASDATRSAVRAPPVLSSKFSPNTSTSSAQPSPLSPVSPFSLLSQHSTIINTPPNSFQQDQAKRRLQQQQDEEARRLDEEEEIEKEKEAEDSEEEAHLNSPLVSNRNTKFTNNSSDINNDNKFTNHNATASSSTTASKSTPPPLRLSSPQSVRSINAIATRRASDASEKGCDEKDAKLQDVGNDNNESGSHDNDEEDEEDDGFNAGLDDLEKALAELSPRTNTFASPPPLSVSSPPISARSSSSNQPPASQLPNSTSSRINLVPNSIHSQLLLNVGEKQQQQNRHQQQPNRKNNRHETFGYLRANNTENDVHTPYHPPSELIVDDVDALSNFNLGANKPASGVSASPKPHYLDQVTTPSTSSSRNFRHKHSHSTSTATTTSSAADFEHDHDEGDEDENAQFEDEFGDDDDDNDESLKRVIAPVMVPAAMARENSEDAINQLRLAQQQKMQHERGDSMVSNFSNRTASSVAFGDEGTKEEEFESDNDDHDVEDINQNLNENSFGINRRSENKERDGEEDVKDASDVELNSQRYEMNGKGQGGFEDNEDDGFVHHEDVKALHSGKDDGVYQALKDVDDSSDEKSPNQVDTRQNDTSQHTSSSTVLDYMRSPPSSATVATRKEREEKDESLASIPPEQSTKQQPSISAPQLSQPQAELPASNGNNDYYHTPRLGSVDGISPTNANTPRTPNMMSSNATEGTTPSAMSSMSAATTPVLRPPPRSQSRVRHAAGDLSAPQQSPSLPAAASASNINNTPSSGAPSSSGSSPRAPLAINTSNLPPHLPVTSAGASGTTGSSGGITVQVGNMDSELKIKNLPSPLEQSSPLPAQSPMSAQDSPKSTQIPMRSRHHLHQRSASNSAEQWATYPSQIGSDSPRSGLRSPPMSAPPPLSLSTQQDKDKPFHSPISEGASLSKSPTLNSFFTKPSSLKFWKEKQEKHENVAADGNGKTSQALQQQQHNHHHSQHNQHQVHHHTQSQFPQHQQHQKRGSFSKRVFNKSSSSSLSSTGTAPSSTGHPPSTSASSYSHLPPNPPLPPPESMSYESQQAQANNLAPSPSMNNLKLTSPDLPPVPYSSNTSGNNSLRASGSTVASSTPSLHHNQHLAASSLYSESAPSTPPPFSTQFSLGPSSNANENRSHSGTGEKITFNHLPPPSLRSQNTGGNNDYSNQPSNPHYYHQPMSSPQMSAISNSDAFSDSSAGGSAGSATGHINSNHGENNVAPSGIPGGIGYRLNPGSTTLSSPMLSSELYHNDEMVLPSNAAASGKPNPNTNTGARRKLANMSNYQGYQNQYRNNNNGGGNDDSRMPFSRSDNYLATVRGAHRQHQQQPPPRPSRHVTAADYDSLT